MFETELKLAIPADRLERVAAQARRGSQRVALKAIYFDTQDLRLSVAHTSLRLRREGKDWAQTAKAPGGNAARRKEHNVPRAAEPGRDEPRLDLSLHDGTPAGKALHKVLDKIPDKAPADASLHEIFRTEVIRHRRTVNTLGARVEVALDEGELVANGGRQAIREIEFELKAGPAAALFALARRWVARHGLWFESRSKAERGAWLSRGEAGGPPRKAKVDKLKDVRAASNEHELLRALVAAALRQALANASEVAAGRETADHVHQLRVGLRRLRTALRAFGQAAPKLLACEPAIAKVFRALGRWRDAGVTREAIASTLHAAGAPALDLPPSADERLSPTKLVRGPAFQAALLDLMEFALDEPARGGAASPGPSFGRELDELLRKRLSRLHRQLRPAGQRFEQLAQDDQHRVRKRLKRLRYLAEFLAPRYKHAAVKRYLAGLEPAQDALGAHNDTVVALARYRKLAASDPNAGFAVGWLTARLDQTASESRQALKRIESAEPFWQ
ncbi:MAG TPA: CYTH and CHAD domain-containing protein [Burkholderiaceae bacterium]|jgi:inorganic triphosphatase YgiF